MKVKNSDEMMVLGRQIGADLRGGEIIELVGDVGVGKTTLAKGIAAGLGVDDTVQSPSFTIARSYAARDGLNLNHYDFYRLDDAGIMRDEIAESSRDPHNITIVEWAGDVAKILPDKRRLIEIKYLPNGEEREVTVK
jgi:tRNA threonylcarbamoyladenosine biosynthesis protein TsaE